MSINSSASMEIPERFRGLQVLLMENDITLQEHLAKILRQNSYQVTTATEVSAGLCMILNGYIYNAVLINADTSDVDIAIFLHKVFEHSPQLSIILMVSVDNYWGLPTEALRNEAVLCLLKPCNHGNICDIWKHICRQKISHQVNVSNGEILHNSNQVSNNIVSSGNGTHQDVDNNSQECAANYEPVTYEALFCDDDDGADDDDQEQVDEIAIQEKIGSGTTEKGDKGKTPVEHDKPRKRMHITWTNELHAKFLEAFNSLGNGKAHASLILKIMNVSGLTRTQVANHLQKHRERLKSNEEFQTSMPAHIKRSNMLQLESNVCKRRGYYTPLNNVASIDQSSSSLLRPWHQPNSTGVSSYMTKSTPLPVSQLTTNTVTNFGNNLATGHNFGGPFWPLMGKFGSVNNSSSFNNGTFGYNASGVGPSVSQVQLNRYGIATEPWVAGCGNVEGSSNRGQESLQVNQENVFPKFPVLSAALSMNNSRFSSLVSLGDVSTGFCGPIFPVKENNSRSRPQPPGNSTTVPLDSSQGEFVGNDLIPNMSDCEPLVNCTTVPLDGSQDEFIDDDLIPNLMSQYEPPVPYILPVDSLQGERIDADSVLNISQYEPPVNSPILPLDGLQGEHIDDDSVQNLSQFDIDECTDLINDYCFCNQ